jgi:PTH1 family peptidyl-tRNA hydrolase
MYVIVGLGNYGQKYEHTRHNAGCDCLSILAGRNFIELKKNKFRALIGEGQICGHKAVLAFPLTYMNLSGESVQELARFYKPTKSQLVVLYDDIDLPQGGLRLRKSGSAGTHNGMRSIIGALGYEDFPRVRLGIGRPTPPMELKDYVLGHYDKTSWEQMFQLYTRGAMAVEELIRNGMDSAMGKFNKLPEGH